MDKKSQTSPVADNPSTKETGLLDSAVQKLTNPAAEVDLRNQVTDTLKGMQNPQTPSKLKPNQLTDPKMQGYFTALQSLHAVRAMFSDANTKGPGGLQAYRQITEKAKSADILNTAAYNQILQSIQQNPQIQAVDAEAERAGNQLYNSSGLKALFNRAVLEINRKNRVRQPLGQQVRAFNLKEYKQAQVNQTSVDDYIPPIGQEELAKAQWVAERIDKILAFRADEGIGIQSYEEIKRDVLDKVSPREEEEANSILEEIRQLDPVLERDEAQKRLGFLYDNFIAPNARGASQMAEDNEVMPNIPANEGVPAPTNIAAVEKKPWSMDLSGQVTNNLEKTAACQFGQEYVLYGPSEKRICPKLRGKQSNGGDVVSEYICRHHCLDGIVIDDNKTICGEALWRANVMDKYSREYVDKDGNIVGGYLNKRFEIDRNVPEENKMRLKPGETRKPRPAEWGNIESRMQAMRQKEAAERGYRPDSNKGDPFIWDKDVDQNNVEQTQAERDRREEAMGHQLVQYTNKDKQENKPELPKKVAFNLKLHKQASKEFPRSFQEIISYLSLAETPEEIKKLVADAEFLNLSSREKEALDNRAKHMLHRTRRPAGQPAFAGNNSADKTAGFGDTQSVTLQDPGTSADFKERILNARTTQELRMIEAELTQEFPSGMDAPDLWHLLHTQMHKLEQHEGEPSFAGSNENAKTAEKWLQDADEKMEEKGTKGSFTEYCGGKVTDECIEKGKNSDNPKTRQKANFAKNVRKIKNKAFNLQEYKTAQLENPDNAHKIPENWKKCPDCNGTGVNWKKTEELRAKGIIDDKAKVRCWTCQGHGFDPAEVFSWENKTATFHDPTQPKPIDDETKPLPQKRDEERKRIVQRHDPDEYIPRAPYSTVAPGPNAQEIEEMKKSKPMLIPDDGIADGGTPYTDDEMDLMEGKPQTITWSQKDNGYVDAYGEVVAQNDVQLADYIKEQVQMGRPMPNVVDNHVQEDIEPAKPMLSEKAEAENIPVPDDGRSPDSNWDKREYTNNLTRTPQPFRRAFNLKEHKEAAADSASADALKKKRTEAARIVTAEPFSQILNPPRPREETTQIFNIPTETLSSLFNGDPEQFEMFWDTLDDAEKSIITHNPQKLAELYQEKQQDVEESAKSLEMDF